MTVKVKITGTGSYLPPYIMNSAELAEATKIKTGEWIEKHLGIKERRFCSLINSETGKAENETNELQMVPWW